MTFADSYAFLDEWVITALRVARDRRDLPAAQRHRHRRTGKIGGAAQKRLGRRRACCTT